MGLSATPFESGCKGVGRQVIRMLVAVVLIFLLCFGPKLCFDLAFHLPYALQPNATSQESATQDNMTRIDGQISWTRPIIALLVR